MADEGAADRRRSLTIVALATIGFVALLIAGLGVVSLALDTAVIAEPGMTQVPGILGTVCALIGFAAVTYPALRRRASVGMALLAGLAASVAYAIGVAAGAVVAGIDPLRALWVAGGIAASWPTLVIVGAGVLSAAIALAVVRTGPGGARWPWERPEHDEE
jgi:cation transport ATPase